VPATTPWQARQAALARALARQRVQTVGRMLIAFFTAAAVR
jgi:hypothetical protein